MRAAGLLQNPPLQNPGVMTPQLLSQVPAPPDLTSQPAKVGQGVQDAVSKSLHRDRHKFTDLTAS